MVTPEPAAPPPPPELSAPTPPPPPTQALNDSAFTLIDVFSE
jgi:hypothetical protein